MPRDRIPLIREKGIQESIEVRVLNGCIEIYQRGEHIMIENRLIDVFCAGLQSLPVREVPDPRQQKMDGFG